MARPALPADDIAPGRPLEDAISIIVPVYQNAENIADLVDALARLNHALGGAMEAVFVVDGSPDDSHTRLQLALAERPFRAQLLLLSRNFGSFAAIRAGLAAARGRRFAVLAADLQEPPELVLTFDEKLRQGSCDIAVGVRNKRNDPLLTRLSARIFWSLYRRNVQPEIPRGGVDVFGCTRQVRDHILGLGEANSSLVGLLFWVGFRRTLVPYERRARTAGRSAWTFSKKVGYLLDSIFSFTDLPVRWLLGIGIVGLLASVLGGAIILVARLTGQIPVAGYTATTLVVIFFGALNCLCLGIIGGYVWRTFENTKGRPNYLVLSQATYDPETSGAVRGRTAPMIES
jgi:polyisoprenyl-phosphate glycosyltransferase